MPAILQHEELYKKYFSAAATEPSKLLMEAEQNGKAEQEEKGERGTSLEMRYSQLDNLFRTDSDAQFGIIRVLEENDKYPTGYAAVRDATNAKAITDPSINHQRVEANNLLLRVLGRIRGIDYVLMQKAKESTNAAEVAIYENLRNKMKIDFAELVSQTFNKATAAKAAESTDAKQKEKDFANYNKILNSSENAFNTGTLCYALHQANLDEQCAKKKDYEKLLFHYRNLSPLIDPACSLVTISYDKTNKVVHRITQDPITQKLEEQKKDIKRDMSKTVLFPTGEERNFQTTQNMAMQEANHYFADLAADDKRMLGAQTRKTHLHGAKNAFFVTNELLFNVEKEQLNKDKLLNEKADLENTQQFTRSATPVYIGKGETDERTQESTRRNIEQIRQFIIKKFDLSAEEADKIKIHYTCLVTDSPMASQSLMIRHGFDATRGNNTTDNDISYVPCNWDGTHRRLDLSPLVGKAGAPSVHPTPSNQAERYRRAAQVSVLIRGKEEVFELVTCASGQDRTETESERASQEWARDRYRTNGINLSTTPPEVIKQSGDAVEQTRATSRNSAEINAHVVGGSRGCKNDSRGKTALVDYDNLYSRETDQAMYLASAKTNKNNKTDKKILKEIMAEPSPIAESQYAAAQNLLKTTCEENAFSLQTKNAGEAVLTQVNEARKRVKPTDMGTLTRTMQEAAAVVKKPEPRQGNPEYAQNIARLGAIAKGLNKKSLLKKVGGALLILGGVALIAAGILFTIPSGGTSLLACILGAKALALGLGAAIGVGTTMAVAGAAATYGGKKVMEKNTRQGLEKESGLITAVKELDQPNQKNKKGHKTHLTVEEDRDSHDIPLLSSNPSSPGSRRRT